MDSNGFRKIEPNQTLTNGLLSIKACQSCQDDRPHHRTQAPCIGRMTGRIIDQTDQLSCETVFLPFCHDDNIENMIMIGDPKAKAQ